MSEQEALREALKQALRGRVRILGLPWRTRLRLWTAHQIDGAGIWLVEHRQIRAAELLWRACGMW
jgi:hypothetical protein